MWLTVNLLKNFGNSGGLSGIWGNLGKGLDLLARYMYIVPALGKYLQGNLEPT